MHPRCPASLSEPPLPPLLPAVGVLKPQWLFAESGGGRCSGGLGAEVTGAGEPERAAPRPGAPWGRPSLGGHSWSQVASWPAVMLSYPVFSPGAATFGFPLFLMKRVFRRTQQGCCFPLEGEDLSGFLLSLFSSLMRVSQFRMERHFHFNITL